MHVVPDGQSVERYSKRQLGGRSEQAPEGVFASSRIPSLVRQRPFAQNASSLQAEPSEPQRTV
jgi:hypothetical protein